MLPLRRPPPAPSPRALLLPAGLLLAAGCASEAADGPPPVVQGARVDAAFAEGALLALPPGTPLTDPAGTGSLTFDRWLSARVVARASGRLTVLPLDTPGCGGAYRLALEGDVARSQHRPDGSVELHDAIDGIPERIPLTVPEDRAGLVLARTLSQGDRTNGWQLTRGLPVVAVGNQTLDVLTSGNLIVRVPGTRDDLGASTRSDTTWADLPSGFEYVATVPLPDARVMNLSVPREAGLDVSLYRPLQLDWHTGCATIAKSTRLAELPPSVQAEYQDQGGIVGGVVGGVVSGGNARPAPPDPVSAGRVVVERGTRLRWPDGSEAGVATQRTIVLADEHGCVGVQSWPVSTGDLRVCPEHLGASDAPAAAPSGR